MKIKQSLIIFFFVSVCSLFLLFKIIQQFARQHDEQTIVVGTSADYPPYAFVDIKSGQVVGFDIDVAKEVVKRLNKNIQVKDIPFASLVFDLFYQYIDIIAAGMSPTEKRSKKVLFSQAYLQDDPLIVLTNKSSKPIQSLEGLQPKKVVVNTGYTADLYLSDKKNIDLVRLKNPAESIVALKSGAADAFVCAKSSLATFMHKKSLAQDFHVAVLPDTGDKYALAVNKNNHRLLEQVNKALDEIKQDGTLELLKKKWNLT